LAIRPIFWGSVAILKSDLVSCNLDNIAVDFYSNEVLGELNTMKYFSPFTLLTLLYGLIYMPNVSAAVSDAVCDAENRVILFLTRFCCAMFHEFTYTVTLACIQMLPKTSEVMISLSHRYLLLLTSQESRKYTHAYVLACTSLSILVTSNMGPNPNPKSNPNARF